MIAPGSRFRLRGRPLLVRPGKAIALFVMVAAVTMMVVMDVTVVMVTALAMGRSRVRVKVRTEVVSGGLSSTV